MRRGALCGGFVGALDREKPGAASTGGTSWDRSAASGGTIWSYDCSPAASSSAGLGWSCAVGFYGQTSSEGSACDQGQRKISIKAAGLCSVIRQPLAGGGPSKTSAKIRSTLS